eukprot:2655420-Rhodomonas_salina.1
MDKHPFTFLSSALLGNVANARSLQSNKLGGHRHRSTLQSKHADVPGQEEPSLLQLEADPCYRQS